MEADPDSRSDSSNVAPPGSSFKRVAELITTILQLDLAFMR
ncbi:hypothetical protein [Rhodococcus sp. USK13]|nr:hypothetical protein [Rhodococcus sp. USK13]